MPAGEGVQSWDLLTSDRERMEKKTQTHAVMEATALFTFKHLGQRRVVRVRVAVFDVLVGVPREAFP